MSEQIPPVYGLVLAGGGSRRMGADKGTLRYGAEAQAVSAWRLLDSLCELTWLSINRGQAGQLPYSALPNIVDRQAARGPAGGLLSAWEAHPNAAWLVLAVDMPAIDRYLLQTILRHRDRRAMATAPVHSDGTIEPLCTLWEPEALDSVRQSLESGQGAGLRHILEAAEIQRVELADADRLISLNTPQDVADWQQHVERRSQSGSVA